MSHRILRIARALAAAAAVAAVAISCPNPIDRELLLVVADEISPLVTITSPTQSGSYRYSVVVSGTIRDSSHETGDGAGFVRRLAFAVSNDATLDRTITFERDGSYAVIPADPTFAFTPATGEFTFTVDTTNLFGMRFFQFDAEDLNGNVTQQTLILMQDLRQPALTVTSPMSGSSLPRLLGISGTALNLAGDTSGDMIGYLLTRIAGFEQVLDLEVLELQPDGKYYGAAGSGAESFWFEPSTGSLGDTFDLANISGNQQLTVEVRDIRGIAATQYIYLIDNNTGPEIKLNFDGSHVCPTIYSSAVTNSITMLGWIEVGNYEPGTASYIVESPTYQRDPVAIVDGVDLDLATGELAFTFNPRQPPALTGRLTVHVYAEDSAGRTSHETHNINDDAASPSGTFTVASDATYATGTATSLTFSVSDALSGMHEMRFSNDGSAWSAWEPYVGGSRAWTLAAGADGPRTVYAQFSDNVGNVLEKSDGITLDANPPTVSVFQLDNGAQYTTDAGHTVELDFTITDSTSGMHQMRLWNDGGAAGAWQPYADAHNESWTLRGEDGVRTVYAEFSDNAGWVRSTSDSITLDRYGPAVSMTINDGALTTATTEVYLYITASDTGSGLDKMRISNDGSSWTSWEDVVALRSWSLDATLGTKTVYLEVRDNVGHVSSTSDTIELVDD